MPHYSTVTLPTEKPQDFLEWSKQLNEKENVWVGEYNPKTWEPIYEVQENKQQQLLKLSKTTNN